MKKLQCEIRHALAEVRLERDEREGVKEKSEGGKRT